MQTTTSSRGQAVLEAIEALSSRSEEPAWLRERRFDAWRLYQELSTDDDVPRFETLRTTPHVEEGPGPEPVAHGVVFAGLHSAAREHRTLLEEYLMSVVPPHEGGDEALNSALWSGGVLVHVPKDVKAEKPLRYLVGGSAGETLFRRVLLIAERGSGATLVNGGISKGRGPALDNLVAEVVVGRGAHVRYVALQDWGKNTDCRITLRAVLDEGSRLELMVVGTGGAATKAKLEAILTAPGATVRIVALALADGDQRLEYSTLQEHRAPETVSDLLFKSALRGRSRLQWRGLTRVHRGAAGVDANQESRSLLLSERAQARPMPVLEIEAYDVSRCSHGATVSSLDEEQLFYLMSRGLSRARAETAMVEGFFRQGLDRLDGDGLREGVERALRRKLSRPGSSEAEASGRGRGNGGRHPSERSRSTRKRRSLRESWGG